MTPPNLFLQYVTTEVINISESTEDAIIVVGLLTLKRWHESDLYKVSQNALLQALESSLSIKHQPPSARLADLMVVRSTLDAQALFLDRVSARLKVQRNALTVDARLPNELLSLIFLELRDALCNVHHPGSRDAEWTGVTHVCHRWREVALGTPALWADVPGWLPLWAEAAIIRSEPLALTLRLAKTEQTKTDPKQLSVIAAAANRLHSLYSERFTIMELTDLFTVSHPALERLEVDCKWTKVEDSTLTAAHFCGQFPALRRLRLNGCYFSDTASPALSSLTHLHIESTPSDRWRLPHLIAFIQDATNITSLTLKWAGPAIAATSTKHTPLLLPHLRTLVLEDRAVSCAYLLPYLPYPLDSLTLHIHQSCSALLNPLLAFAVSFWRDIQMTSGGMDAARLRVDEARTHCGPKFYSSINVSSSVIGLGGIASASTDRVRLRLTIEDENSADAYRLLRHTWTSLPLSLASTMHLHGVFDLDNLLTHAAMCKTLHVDGAHFGQMARLSRADTLSAPLLETIHIHPEDQVSWMPKCDTERWFDTRRRAGYDAVRLALADAKHSSHIAQV